MGIFLGILGLILFLVGWIWLMVVAGKTSGPLWAVIVFFFNWLGGLIFCIVKKAGWMQWGLMVVGFLLIVVGSVVQYQDTKDLLNHTVTPVR
jgi:hypothetical protein